MANTNEEIMLTLGMNDNASRVAQSAASNIQSSLSSLNSAMMNFGQVTDNVMQSLTGKSAMDNILGTSSKAETNKVLLNNMTETKKGAEDLYKTVDKVTDSSLTSMQELIPSMKAFKSATGASDKEMINITDDMANFGAAVLAQTGSTDLAQQSMMDLSKGIKGAFASLDQYGITEASLKRTGYWNGDEKDVEGFMKAVSAVTGSTKELMETNQGLDALIGKAFSRAGKKMGNEFLPVIKDIKRGFLDLDESLGGNLTASILAVSGGIEVMNTGLWNVSTTVKGMHDLSDAFSTLKSRIKGAGEAAEATGDAINTISNASDIVGGAGGAVGAGADIAKGTGRTEKLVNSGAEGLMFADMIKGNKKAQKDADKLLKELGLTEQIAGDVSKKHKSIYDPKKWSSFDNYLKVKRATNMEMGSSKGRDGILSIIDSVNGTKKEVSKVADAVDNVGDIGKELTGAKKIAEGMEAVEDVGSAMSTVGPALESSATGAEAAAAGSAGLAASFTSMIVPLLAISAVIAIMIPIVAGLAIEAMFFIKIVADFMASMNFEGINLDGAAKGLQSLTLALLWIGAAMLALTAVNITTSLAAVTSMFLGLTGPLEQATSALKKAAELLQGFNTISIDPSIAGKLQTIANSLVSVSTAMLALTSTNITTGFSDFVAWALGFGSVTDGLEQAKNDIITASSKLNEFSGITPLDDKVAKNIQNVCDSLASVGNAMSALRSIRDGQNWDDIFSGLMTGLFGEGVDIQTALLNVKNDIIQASQALAQFTGISEIPEDVSGKIQKVGDTLKTVSDAVTNIKNLVGSGFDNWVEGLFGGYDIAGGLEKIKNDLMIASQKLAELSGLSEVNEDITTKIQAISNALAKVNEVSGTLVNLGSSGIAEFDSSIIATAVTNVQTAATELAKLNEITFDGAAADTILGAIQTTLENVKSTLAAATGFSEAATTIGSQIVSGVQSGLSPLGGTVIGIVDSAVIGAGGVALSGGASLGRSVNNGFKSTLDLHSIMATEMDYVVDAVNNGIEAAKSAAQSGAQEVVAAFKSGINVGSPGDIARTMKQELIYTKDFILAAYAPLSDATYSLGRSIVNGFGNPLLSLDMFTNGGQLTAEHIGALKTTISRSPDKADNRPVTIIVSENAVNVDARNYTTKEAQGLMITAFEGLNSVKNIDVDI